MMGAMPWAIRNAFHHFEGKLKPETLHKDLTTVETKSEDNPELDEAELEAALAPLAEAAMQADQEMMYFLGTLPEATRAKCNDPQYYDLVARCEAGAFQVTDAVYPLCQIVLANKLKASGGMTHAVVAFIMAKANKMFQTQFGDLLSGGEVWDVLQAACQKHTHTFLGLNRRKRMAKQASCFHDGDWMGVNKEWVAYDTDKKKVKKRKAQVRVAFRLDSERPIAIRKVRHLDSDKRDQFKSPEFKRFGVQQRLKSDWVEGADFSKIKRSSDGGEGRGLYNATIANGFEGAVEYIIRRKICGQSSLSAASDRCSNAIPDKPPGVKW
ncbi:MAG: hypothetical protein KGP28_11135 [Bdellovibrionales bacterium]|nr:hypothetical protein [Bdellovibrionales bacterium]